MITFCRTCRSNFNPEKRHNCPGPPPDQGSGGKKETNPKDAIGVGKMPLSTVSAAVLGEVGVAMLEGARKYGRHNYRVAGVRASVYYDGTMRHLMAWWEGQDIDPDSGLNHITKAITSLIVFRDAMINGMWEDDRPPPVKNQEWMAQLNAAAKAVIAKYPDPLPPYTVRSVSLNT